MSNQKWCETMLGIDNKNKYNNNNEGSRVNINNKTMSETIGNREQGNRLEDVTESEIEEALNRENMNYTTIQSTGNLWDKPSPGILLTELQPNEDMELVRVWKTMKTRLDVKSVNKAVTSCLLHKKQLTSFQWNFLMLTNNLHREYMNVISKITRMYDIILEIIIVGGRYNSQRIGLEMSFTLSNLLRINLGAENTVKWLITEFKMKFNKICRSQVARLRMAGLEP